MNPTPVTWYLVISYVRKPVVGEVVVGLIVGSKTRLFARFLGEKDSTGETDSPGEIDATKLPSVFASPELYADWVRYWRKAVREPDLVVEDASPSEPHPETLFPALADAIYLPFQAKIRCVNESVLDRELPAFLDRLANQFGATFAKRVSRLVTPRSANPRGELVGGASDRGRPRDPAPGVWRNPGSLACRTIPAPLVKFAPLLDALANVGESADRDLYFNSAFDHTVVRPATQAARELCHRRGAGQGVYASIQLSDVVNETLLSLCDPSAEPFDPDAGILESAWIKYHANAAFERLRNAATGRPLTREGSPRRRVDKFTPPPDDFVSHRPDPDDTPADERLDVQRAVRDLDAGGRLTDLEKAIFRGHYTAGKTLREVSAELDAAPRLVYAAHEALLRKLRSRLRGYEA